MTGGTGTGTGTRYDQVMEQIVYETCSMIAIIIPNMTAWSNVITYMYMQW